MMIGLLYILVVVGIFSAWGLFLLWGTKINREDRCTNPVHAESLKTTSAALHDHDCECMAEGHPGLGFLGQSPGQNQNPKSPS